MENFKSAVNYCVLQDIQFSGYPFTWSNGREGDRNIQCCLDRFFGNIQSMQMGNGIKVFHLKSSYSDHLPIMLDIKEPGQQKQVNKERPFRFEKMWCGEDGFPDKINSASSGIGEK